MPLLVVSYEDLLNNTLREIVKIMKFLSVPFESHSLQKLVAEGFSMFHRHSATNKEYFTSSQWQYLQETLASVHRELQRTGPSVLASYVHSYMHSSSTSGGQHEVT